MEESGKNGGQDEFVQRMRRVLRCRKQGVPVLVMYNSNLHLTCLDGNRVKYALKSEIRAHANGSSICRHYSLRHVNL